MSLNSLANIPGWEELPLQSPPPGVTPNFLNPESNAYQVDIFSGIFLALIFVSAGIRFYVKTFFLRKRTRDDIPYFCAFVASVTYIMLTTILVHNGAYGLHAWDVRYKDISVVQLRLSLVVLFIYIPFIWLVKIPLFLLYIEIFGSLKWMRYACWTAMVLTGLFYLSSIIFLISACSPNTRYSQFDYLSALFSAECTQNTIYTITQGVVNIGSDLLLLVLPLPSIWSLQLSFRRKLGVSTMCLTGLLACAGSCVALWSRLMRMGLPQEVQDNTWITTSLWITTMFEMTSGVIIPAAPSISVFWRRSFIPFVSKIMTNYSPCWSNQKASISGPTAVDDKSELQYPCNGAREVDSEHNFELSDLRRTTEIFTSKELHTTKPQNQRDFI